MGSWRFISFQLLNELSLAKTHGSHECLVSMTVDNFVAAKASNFNKVQQTSTSRSQTFQQQSLSFNKNS